MKIIRNIPFFLYLLIAYNIIAFYPNDPETGTLFNQVLFEFKLMSEAIFVMDVNTLLIFIGLHALYFEILRSTRSSVSTIISHMLSLIVFIIFLVEFIVVKQAGTACFLILTFMSLLVIISGYTVSISSARRDIVVDH